MELILRRKYKKADYTIGKLYNDMQYLCDTMEPPVRNIASTMSAKAINKVKEQYGPTAIPPGRYPIVINWSNKFGKWLPLLVGVKGYNGVRIHAGNKPSETQGCILPGYNNRPGYLLQSTTCLNTIMRLLQDCFDKGGAAWITIS